MDKNTNKVSNLYGRARRIAFVEKVIYWIVGILAIVLIAFLILNKKEEVDRNVNFAYLSEYLEARGYRCEMIYRIGGQCIKTGSYSNEEEIENIKDEEEREKMELINFNYSYNFIRYDDGFEYIYNSRGFILDIRHKSGDDSRVSFRTTNNAFQGYKNQSYSCEFKNNVISELGDCISTSGVVLDNETYKSIISQSMVEVNNILDNSGYKKDVLLNNYKWEKDETK